MSEQKLISRIHHVTAICGDPQVNLDFYAGILGLRLVKKTVNFDAPEIYHLYYGNEKGDPGTIMTFFPYPNASYGRVGNGQLTITAFSIAENSIDYWLKRLTHFNVPHTLTEKKLGDETVISLKDPNGIFLELVANSKDQRVGNHFEPISQEYAIKGFYGVTLSVKDYASTASIMTDFLNYHFVEQFGNRFRLSVNDRPGDYVDIQCNPDVLSGKGGIGTIHHVAFTTKNKETQHLVCQKLLEKGFNVTQVVDRKYFYSVYFREPNGILFEIATHLPGFTVDEDLKDLGTNLKLPAWHESNRDLIEKVLLPIEFDIKRFFHE